MRIVYIGHLGALAKRPTLLVIGASSPLEAIDAIHEVEPDVFAWAETIRAEKKPLGYWITILRQFNKAR